MTIAHFIFLLIYEDCLYIKGTSLLIYIHSFITALALDCCAQACSSCSEQGLLFVIVCGLLTAVASLVEDRL